MAKSTRIRSRDIQVDGLVELNRALKAMGPEFPRELRAANRSVAELVARDARSAAQSVGGVAAHVAPSIKASAGTQSASVAIGGGDYPMAGGAEFGSVKYPQFQRWRGNDSDAGYFLYPSIRHDADRIQTEYTQKLDDLIRRVGLK